MSRFIEMCCWLSYYYSFEYCIIGESGFLALARTWACNEERFVSLSGFIKSYTPGIMNYRRGFKWRFLDDEEEDDWFVSEMDLGDTWD